MRNYPIVPEKPVTDLYFGREVMDPYRYLEDAKSEETLKIVAEENEYTHRFFRENADEFSAAELEAKLRALPHEADLSCVCEAGGLICAMRKLEGGIQDIVSLDEEMNVKEVLLNEEMMDNRLHFSGVKICPTNPDLIIGLGMFHGHPRNCIVLWDIRQKKALAEFDGTFSHDWSWDGRYIFFPQAELDAANNRNINHVRRYDWQADRLDTLYTHMENAVAAEVASGPDGGCFITILNTYTDYLLLWHDGRDGITRLNDGLDSYMFIGEGAGRCYFKTNASAPMARIISVSTEQLKEEGCLLNGFEVALPEADCLLASAGIAQGGILAAHERDAASEMALFSFDGKLLERIEMPDRFGSAKLTEAFAPSDRGRVFFGYESFTRKLSLFALDEKSLAVTRLRGEEEDTSDIAVDQCFLNARDGQRILVYVVRPADLKPDGKTPVLMFGYGGYAFSMPPWPKDMVTEHSVVEWVRMGRIYAHCILRGGMEYGEEWHRGAMKGSKKNAFYDFIDIAEYLVESGWTNPGQIVATGKSNGGLLVTAAATLRPDLFGVVIASVPHTDMLRFRCDARGMMYILEYGDPQGSEEMFDYMYSYSPYHNIRPGTVYPWMYVQTGEMDNNVPPYHGKKFAVRLQKAADEKNPVLLEVLAHGSHDRGVGDEYYMNISQMQTFVEMGLAANRK